jgi:cupin superfamily acireductone dioxygenase involved in methionine salvage
MRMIVDFAYVTRFGEKGECTQTIDCKKEEIEKMLKAYGGFKKVDVLAVRMTR